MTKTDRKAAGTNPAGIPRLGDAIVALWRRASTCPRPVSQAPATEPTAPPMRHYNVTVLSYEDAF